MKPQIAKAAEWSDEDVNFPIDGARKEMADVLAEGQRGADQMVYAFHGIAHAEGVAQARYMVRSIAKAAVEAGWSEAEVSAKITDAMFDRASNGADDQWSGRGNDVKRAKFDGFMVEAKRWVDVAKGW